MSNEVMAITPQNAEIKAMEYIEHIKNMDINTPESNEAAAEFLKGIVKYAKEVDACQKEQIKPLKEQMESIKGSFAKPVDFLKQADNAVRTKMNAYAQKVFEEKQAKEREERRLAQEAETKRLAELEAKAKAESTPEVAAEVSKSVDEQFNAVVYAPVAPTKVSGTQNSAVSMVWDFFITDENAIPREYLVIDSVKIRAAIRNGTREIPGVKIEQKAQVRIK